MGRSLLWTVILFISTLLSTETWSATTHRKMQFNFQAGIDIPDDPDTGTTTKSTPATQSNTDREDTATFVRLGLSTKPIWIRLAAATTFLTGSEYMQAEFNLGLQLYFLSYLFQKSPVQPYFYGDGTVGVGRYLKETRLDTGYEIGAGADIRMGRNWGFNVGGSIRLATENAFRYWGGIFYQR